MTRHERLKRRLPQGTPEESAQEFADEALRRAFRIAMTTMDRAKVGSVDQSALISDHVVNFCAKSKIEVATLTDKIHAVEAARVEKIKLEEAKLNGGKIEGGLNEIGQ